MGPCGANPTRRSPISNQILATDYDGTLTDDGFVAPAVMDGLRRLKRSGRGVVLVTGRDLAELMEVCPTLDVFDRVVAENGGLLYRPATGDTIPLADPPDARFVERLRRQGVPLVVGRVIVATRVPHDREVLAAIDELGLGLQISYNKGAVMVMPAGVSKATGLQRALEELGASPGSTTAVGDAENDEPFFEVCARLVAVANAVPSLKRRAHVVTTGAAGEGVLELVESMMGREVTRS